MDLLTLNLFLDVAHAQSFAAVARARGIEPSSVSRAIATLEASLGARLFHRTTRTMVLTEAGELLRVRAPTLVAELTRLGEELTSSRSDPVGVVRLTASVAYGARKLAPLLPDFRSRFPRLRLELLLSDAKNDIVAERIDLAIRLGPSQVGDVESEKLAPTRYHVVASKAYIAASGAPSQPADLMGRDCLLFALPEFRTRWLFRNHMGDEESVSVTGPLVVSNALVLREAALVGLGPALLADWLIEEDLSSGGLVDLFPHHRATATSFDTAAWLLYPSGEFLPKRVRNVADFLRQRLSVTS